jgi:hypothetical protein
MPSSVPPGRTLFPMFQQSVKSVYIIGCSGSEEAGPIAELVYARVVFPIAHNYRLPDANFATCG